MSFIDRMYESTPVQILFALIFNGFYAVVLGLSLIPSTLIIYLAIDDFIAVLPLGMGNLLPLLKLSILAGLAVFTYFLWGAMLQSSLIRLLSWGLKPGRYPKVSFTTLRWILYSGISNIANRTILNFIPVSWFATAYFRIVGARIGKNVYINTAYINDAYLVTLEEGAIIGGTAEISAHLMEKEWLYLLPVHVGKNSLVGTGAYISPGVHVGDNCVIGARSYIRRGTRIPDNSIYSVLSGLPMRQLYGLEKGWTRRGKKAGDFENYRDG